MHDITLYYINNLRFKPLSCLISHGIFVCKKLQNFDHLILDKKVKELMDIINNTWIIC